MDTNEKKPDVTRKEDLKKKQDSEIDRQMKESFPASDPPSYSGGKHIIGAPKQRKSIAPKPGSQAVKEAERKVKEGSAKEPTTY